MQMPHCGGSLGLWQDWPGQQSDCAVHACSEHVPPVCETQLVQPAAPTSQVFPDGQSADVSQRRQALWQLPLRPRTSPGGQPASDEPASSPAPASGRPPSARPASSVLPASRPDPASSGRPASSEEPASDEPASEVPPSASDTPLSAGVMSGASGVEHASGASPPRAIRSERMRAVVDQRWPWGIGLHYSAVGETLQGSAHMNTYPSSRNPPALAVPRLGTYWPLALNVSSQTCPPKATDSV